MFFPISRIVALLMAAVLSFLLVQMSLARHYTGLAIFIVIVFIAYLAGNVALWLRMRPR
jgi:hypothetical protein